MIVQWSFHQTVQTSCSIVLHRAPSCSIVLQHNSTTAALLLPQLLHSSINQPNGGGLDMARNLLQFVMPVYLTQLKEEVNAEVLTSVSEGICDVARYCYFSGGTNKMTGTC
jgi:hypothetical protein